MPREAFLAYFWGYGSGEKLRKYGSKLGTSKPRWTFTGSYKKVYSHDLALIFYSLIKLYQIRNYPKRVVEGICSFNMNRKLEVDVLYTLLQHQFLSNGNALTSSVVCVLVCV